jgi:hypothetical protein
LGYISKKLKEHRETSSRKTWKRYFEARVAVMVEWYGISECEIIRLIAEKMEMGYRGEEVFDAVKEELEGRSTRIIDRR